MKKLSLFFCLLLLSAVNAAAVTFNVQVPPGTKKCYVCGDFNGWKPDVAPELTPSGTNMFTLTLPEVTSVSGGYKYLCGPSWDYVEKSASGAEIDNRTSIGNPDVVGSWYKVPDYSIATEKVTVNGIERLVKIYLPDGYDTSSEAYPVIYYNTVQQRFNDAGSDTDAGDDFFASYSWHAQTTMESLRASGGKAYVMVQICSFLAENTPEANDEFVGTGAAADYLTAFTGELMPYVSSKYRIKSGAENTTIVGADYGALFALYASLKRPDLFGTCVAMSPMLWINPGAINALASEATAAQKYYLSAGSLEPQWMLTDANALYQDLTASSARAYYTEVAGGKHTDDSWGAAFGSILSAINSDSAPKSPRKAGAISTAASELESAVYTLYGGPDANDLTMIGRLEYVEDYYSGKDTETRPAMVITNVIPVGFKSKYYWNIAKGADSSAGWLLSSPKNVSFSSKKNADSWHNIAVFEDETEHNVAAHSKAFSVVTGTGDKTTMTGTSGFVSTASVEFPTTNKTFTIHYGSVNSGSDMGAATKEYAVSETCTKADISYDFNTNRVTITETEGGEPEPEFKDRTFTVYGGTTQGSLEKIAEMTYTEDFRKKGSDTPVKAFVYTIDVPASVKSNYYYNVAKGSDSNEGWVASSDHKMGFKSSKNEISWISVAVFEDGTMTSIGAHSKGFRVVTSDGDVTMTRGNAHLSTATVKFPGSDKKFGISYGSVNTASDMGSMTSQFSVSEDCIEAAITYDFNLNKVTVQETAFGQSLSDIAITEFTAAPSVVEAGKPVAVTLTLSEPCDAKITCVKDFTTPITVTATQSTPGSYALTLPTPETGIYTFSASLTLGSNTIDNAAEINVRVVPQGTAVEKSLTVNAYADVDWNSTLRCKANFHTHTTQSFDANFSTSETVDRYHAAGYTVLALTDHDANPYPWDKFSLYNSSAQDRDPAALGMLAIPGIELSKDRRNNWSESTGGEFNHHNDFFTGRQGQEFMSLRESYAYTDALGGMQIINHPGQYWNLSTNYSAGAKNSPEWHAENFRLYKSLIGFEVYNQGNRRPNDRILWDQVLTINMPENPVWGYSCDDMHNAAQCFRNYQFMLMPSLSTDDLKTAMKTGATVFSYEPAGTGEDLAPHVKSIKVDPEAKTITVDSDDADRIEWIYSTHRTNASSVASTKSTIVGIGKTFPFKDYQGSYVRARLTNKNGETATQPFGFNKEVTTSQADILADNASALRVSVDADMRTATMECTEPMLRLTIFNIAGTQVKYEEFAPATRHTISTATFAPGVYIIVVATDRAAYTAKFPIR